MATFQTPVGVLSYPHLFKPAPRAEGNPELVYSAVLLLDETQMKSPAFAAMVRALEDCARMAYPKGVLGKTLKSPIRSTDEKENFPSGFKVFFNSWSKLKPGVVDVQKEDILDSNDVWAGQLARFVVNTYPWEHSGKKGVNLGLQHVQIIKSDGMKRLDGRKSPKESFDDEYDSDDEV